MPSELPRCGFFKIKVRPFFIANVLPICHVFVIIKVSNGKENKKEIHAQNIIGMWVSDQ